MENLIPLFILENFRNNQIEGKFDGFAMSIDMSGFTPMTENLMKAGSEGAEILSEILKNVFSNTVYSVYNSGGFITSFAGDGFTALYPSKEHNSLTIQANSILTSAIKILEYIQENEHHRTKYGEFNVNVKIGISYGNVEWAIVGEDQKTFYFKGDSVIRCKRAEKKAVAGEIITDEFFFKYLKLPINQFSKIDEFHYKIIPALISKVHKEYIFTSDLKTGFSSITKELFTKKFVSQSIINFKNVGEFRDVISVFVNFNGPVSSDKIKSFLSLFMKEVIRFSGYLKDIEFSDRGGVAVCYFGAPLAHETYYKNAFDFIQTIKKIICFDKNPDKIKIRAGMTLGKNFTGIIGGEERSQYSVLGNSVNLASRFMEVAKWSEIWVNEQLYKKLNSPGNFLPEGKHNIKGYEDEIQVYKLTENIDVLEKAKSIHTDVMIGREQELNKLYEYVNNMFSTKTSGIVYIYGEAGIGKTRLIKEFKKTKGKEKNIIWLQFHTEQLLKQPLNPVKNFLKEYFRQSNDNSAEINRKVFNLTIDELINKLEDYNITDKTDSSINVQEIINELERTRSILGVLVDLHWKGSLYEKLDPKLRFDNTLFAVYNFILAQSVIQPVLIIIEDAQWLDKETTTLFELLLRNLSNQPLTIICTSRFLDNGRKFSLSIPDEKSRNEILLRYFTKDDIRIFAESIFKGNADEKLITLLQNKTNGNPYFLEQVILHLQEKGILTNEKNTFNVSSGSEDIVPSSISAVLTSRFDGLPEDIKEIIRTASVLGNEFDTKILTEMLKNVENINVKIKIAEKENIWFRTGKAKYSFKHDLLRNVVYNLQLKSKLRELHLIAANAIEKVNAKNYQHAIEVYCYHLGVGCSIINEKGSVVFKKENHPDKATIENTEKYIKLQESLADKYRKEYKNEKAIELYDSLIELCNINKNKGLNFNLLLHKSDVLNLIGEWKESEKVVKNAKQIAKSMGSKEKTEIANKYLGQVYNLLNDYNRAISYFMSALKYFKTMNDLTKVMELYGCFGKVLVQKGELTEALIYFKKQNRIAVKIKNINNKVYSAHDIGSIYRKRAEFGKALNCFNNNMKLLKKKSNWINEAKSLEAETMINIGTIHYSKGNYHYSLIAFKKALGRFNSIGNKKGFCIASYRIGNVYFQKREFNKTIKYYQQAFTTHKILNDAAGIALYYGNMGSVYLLMGNYQNSLLFYEKYLIMTESLGRKRDILLALGNIGLIYTEMGLYKKALMFLKRHLLLSNRFRIPDELYRAYTHLGTVSSYSEDFTKAKEYFVKALNICRDSKLLKGKIISLYNIAEMSYKMKDFNTALKSVNESYSLAARADLAYEILLASVLKEKIIIYKCFDLISDSISARKNQNIKKLKNHLNLLKSKVSKSDDIEYRARINYDLYKINDLCYKNFLILKKENIYRTSALKYYKLLRKRTSRKEISGRIEELSR